MQSKPNPTSSICLFVICPVAVCAHTNPYLRTYSALSFGVTLQVDRRAWQEGRKPLALLLACHWCMPLGAMCHILQLEQAAFLEKAPNNAVQIRDNLAFWGDNKDSQALNMRELYLQFAEGKDSWRTKVFISHYFFFLLNDLPISNWPPNHTLVHNIHTCLLLLLTLCVYECGLAINSTRRILYPWKGGSSEAQRAKRKNK